MEQNLKPANGRFFCSTDFENGVAAMAPQAAAIFDGCVGMVLDGTARIIEIPGPHHCLRFQDAEIEPNSVLDYYLRRLTVDGFSYQKAHDFAEKFRQLQGYFSGECDRWVHRCLRDAYFRKVHPDNEWNNEWALNPDQDHSAIPEDFLRFACYVAVCHMKYGPSYASVMANRIFGYVTAIGSDLPAELKKNGSGMLPKEVTQYKDAEVTCKANDAFATISITLKAEREENYAKALEFLCRLLASEFPHSYAIDFRSPEKGYLPVKGLPKKGVHQLFANAVRYPALHPAMEQYARLAIHEFAWYTHLDDENCAMPGTFAVFALGLADVRHAPLLLHYFAHCDDEHSSIQGKFLPAYIQKFGFTAETLPVFLAGVGSMQELPPDKTYAAAIANEASLRLLLAARTGREPLEWAGALYALWGQDAVEAKGAKTIRSAPASLKPLYEEIFAR